MLKAYSIGEDDDLNDKNRVDTIANEVNLNAKLLPAANDSTESSITTTSSYTSSPINHLVAAAADTSALQERIQALHHSQEQFNTTQELTSQQLQSLSEKTEQIARETRQAQDSINAIFQTSFLPTENGQVMGVMKMKNGAIVRVVNPELEDRMHHTMVEQQTVQEEMLSLREEVFILRDELARLKRELAKKE